MKPAHVAALPMRVRNGRREYEITPGRWVSRQRVHQLSAVYAGRCVRCTAPAEISKTMCRRHLEQMRDDNAARTAKRRKAVTS